MIQAGKFVGIYSYVKSSNENAIIFVRSSAIHRYVESMKAELIELENKQR